MVSGALIPDIMHDVLEGALPLEMKLMLKVFIKPLLPNILQLLNILHSLHIICSIQIMVCPCTLIYYINISISI